MSETNLFSQVLEQESKAISLAATKVNEEQVHALKTLFEVLLSTGGSLVVLGIGKSGLVGQKIAATFTSLGLSSYFLHPTEALHGDLGRITSSDAICLISKSGSTQELIQLLPFLKIPASMTIGLLGNTKAPLAEKCGILLDCSVEKEACLNNQAPTTSTTVTLAMGDAMAVLYEKVTGLSKEGFALNHPGGFLGKSLRLRVADLMVPKDKCATVESDASLKDVVLAMTKNPLGICLVANGDELEGIIVEGDIRRVLASDDTSLASSVSSVMNKKPTTVDHQAMAFEAMKVMENPDRLINVLPVLEGTKVVGILRLHDLLQEGFA